MQPIEHNEMNGMSLPRFGNKSHSGFHFGCSFSWTIRITKGKNKLPIMQVWEGLDPRESVLKSLFFLEKPPRDPAGEGPLRTNIYPDGTN